MSFNAVACHVGRFHYHRQLTYELCSILLFICKSVPLETAIIIVFPKSSTELIPGLPESKCTDPASGGGSYKTKILKPMADVEDDDILDALPPAFKGGRRTMEKLCLYARDVMIGQITQLFGVENDNSSIQDRRSMAEYLQLCLKEYIDRDCQPPEEGQPFPTIPVSSSRSSADTNNASTINTNESSEQARSSSSSSSSPMNDATSDGHNGTSSTSIPKTGNIVIKRVLDDDDQKKTSTATEATKLTTTVKPTTTSSRGVAAMSSGSNGMFSGNDGASSSISRLFDRQHAPGIRKPGCPCCDPDNTSTVVDNMMML